MRKALITGITGQDGSYLAELLLQKGYDVIGLDRRKAVVGRENLQTVLHHKNFHIVEGELTEASRIRQIIEQEKPDELYHLASQSLVPYSWVAPVYTTHVNAVGTLYLLDAIKQYSPLTRFYFASSSEIFGLIHEPFLHELSYHHPRSPYACAKSFGHNITRNYRESYGLFCCNGILFNHESERRGKEFITRKVSSQVAEIACGKRESLAVGNLESKRDWGYSPDYVDAMYRMLQKDMPDDYVIATGHPHSVRELVEFAFSSVGMSVEWKGSGLDEKGYCDGRMVVSVAKEFFRPAEVDILCGDAAKAQIKLGWKPIVGFEEMIHRMVNYDMKQVQGEQYVYS